MAEKMSESKRSHVGFGSTYLRGGAFSASAGINTVLGGQVWTVKPDKDAAAKNPCLWMQSGVVSFKSCNNFYDCTSCKYDQGMQLQVEKGKQMSWQAAMRTNPDLHRFCRHSLTNRIASRVCAYDYQCGHCDFDQFFEDVWSPATGGHASEVGHVRGVLSLTIIIFTRGILGRALKAVERFVSDWTISPPRCWGGQTPWICH